MTQSALFRGIGDWLLQRALRECDLGETVRGLGQKLLAGGLPGLKLAGS